MKRMFTAIEKGFVFDSWKNGIGFSAIAKSLDTKPGNIFTILRDSGGIKPPPRKRAPSHLTLSEREEIRVLLSSKLSIRAIASVLGRSPSTISREVQRNRGRRYYKAVDANNRASRMARRPKPCLLERNQELKELVLDALLMAVWRRNPKETVTVHSDQGSQYTSHDWSTFLKSNNLEGSMSRRGNCHDNAVAESFFQLLKRERIKRRVYSNRDDARRDIFDYIEMFYNVKRRHGFNDQLSPVEYEKRFEKAATECLVN